MSDAKADAATMAEHATAAAADGAGGDDAPAAKDPDRDAAQPRLERRRGAPADHGAHAGGDEAKPAKSPRKRRKVNHGAPSSLPP